MKVLVTSSAGHLGEACGLLRSTSGLLVNRQPLGKALLRHTSPQFIQRSFTVLHEGIVWLFFDQLLECSHLSNLQGTVFGKCDIRNYSGSLPISSGDSVDV